MRLGNRLEGSINAITNQLLGKKAEVEYVAFLDGGWSNKNYHIVADGRHMVLRIKNRPPPSPNFEPSYLAQRCAPELIAYDEETGHMLTGWVEGTLLHESPTTPGEVATYVRDLHEAIPNDVSRYDVTETIGQMYVQSATQTDEQGLFEAETWEPQSTTGCHNDLNPYNVIRTKNGFCTVDWESAGDNDPLFDLAGICLGLHFSDEETNQCIKAYLVNEVSATVVLATRRVYQFREHAWALREIKLGNDTPDIQNQVKSTSKEIQRLTHLLRTHAKH